MGGGASLLVPSFIVDAHYKQPQHQRNFSGGGQDLIIGRKVVTKWRPQKGEPTQPGKSLQHSDNSRHESRPKDEVADQHTPNAKERQIGVESPTAESENDYSHRL